MPTDQEEYPRERPHWVSSCKRPFTSTPTGYKQPSPRERGQNDPLKRRRTGAPALPGPSASSGWDDSGDRNPELDSPAGDAPSTNTQFLETRSSYDQGQRSPRPISEPVKAGEDDCGTTSRSTESIGFEDGASIADFIDDDPISSPTLTSSSTGLPSSSSIDRPEASRRDAESMGSPPFYTFHVTPPLSESDSDLPSVSQLGRRRYRTVQPAPALPIHEGAVDDDALPHTMYQRRNRRRIVSDSEGEGMSPVHRDHTYIYRAPPTCNPGTIPHTD